MVGQFSNSQNATTFTFDNLETDFIGFHGSEDSSAAVSIGVIEINPLCIYSDDHADSHSDSAQGGYLIGGIIVFIVVGVSLFVFWYCKYKKTKNVTKVVDLVTIQEKQPQAQPAVGDGPSVIGITDDEMAAGGIGVSSKDMTPNEKAETKENLFKDTEGAAVDVTNQDMATVPQDTTERQL